MSRGWDTPIEVFESGQDEWERQMAERELKSKEQHVPPGPEPLREPQRTKHGHIHGEAFMLMWYECRGCGARERVWNSRDGVTPFGMGCASCGTDNMLHTNW